ncbi:hypothetical protein DFS34DRAFT_658599 [Phlyctochytrium arcticum]|nr:hypothetical protein DFS34DRAFT_658599 [Phlyctochytrium arcticum]
MKVPSGSNIVALICSLITPALLGKWLTTGSHTADAGCYKCHSDAPAYFDGYIGSGQTTPKLMRVVCNDDVAIYMDDEMRGLPRSTTSWILPFYTKAWRHMKKTYGSCAVPREISGDAGPNCENFGSPKPYVAQLGNVNGGQNWYRYYFRFEEPTDGARPGNRNLFMATEIDWSNSNYHVKQRIICIQGISFSPFRDFAFGHEPFESLCMYDFYNRTGFTTEAAYEHTVRTAKTHNMPPGASNTRWFRDWLYPLWVDSGNNMDSHARLYELVSLHYPTKRSANGLHTEYMSQLNIGDLVHFMSAAQGRSLVNMAATVFNTGWRPDLYAASRTQFPAVSAMYT